MRWIAVLAAAVLVILAACTSGAAGSPPASPAPSPVSGPPTPAPTTTRTTAPTPRPTPTPLPTPTPVAIDDLAWERLTTLNGVAAGGIVGFAGGYVVVSETGVFWSADGTVWTSVEIPSRVSGVASSGQAVLLVGSEDRDCSGECPPDSTGCGGPTCQASPVAWLSVDGRSWERSKAWPIATVDSDAYMGLLPEAWAVPGGGWEVALSYITGDSSQLLGIFHSDDGLEWSAVPAAIPTSAVGSPAELFWGPGAAGQDGERLLVGWTFADDAVATALYSSPDGRSWTWLEGFPEAGLMVSDLVASPAGGAPLWLVAGTGGMVPERDEGRPTVWTTPDLSAWSGQALTMGDAAAGSITGLAATSFGYVAVGSVYDTPESAPTDASWLSSNGMGWIPLAVPTEPGVKGPRMVADGPAGVIGISEADDTGDAPAPNIVWALR